VKHYYFGKQKGGNAKTMLKAHDLTDPILPLRKSEFQIGCNNNMITTHRKRPYETAPNTRKYEHQNKPDEAAHLPIKPRPF